MGGFALTDVESSTLLYIFYSVLQPHHHLHVHFPRNPHSSSLHSSFLLKKDLILPSFVYLSQTILGLTKKILSTIFSWVS